MPPLDTSHVNISTPTTNPLLADSNVIQAGDLHANAINLISILIEGGIAKVGGTTLDTHIFTPEKTFNTLLKIYDQPATEWDADFVAFAEGAIGSVEFINLKKHLLLIGDTVFDRGSNDLLVLILLFHMHTHGLSYDILAGNHEMEFIAAIENGFLFGEREFILRHHEYPDSGISAKNLQVLIDNDLVTRSLVTQLYEQAFLPHLKLASYVLSDDDSSIDIFAHTPYGVSINGLIAIHKAFYPSTRDINDISLPELIDDINAKFQEFAQMKIINSLFYMDPFAEFIWGRNYEGNIYATTDASAIEKYEKKYSIDVMNANEYAPQREALLYSIKQIAQKYKSVNSIHGHGVQDPENRPNGVELYDTDSLVGKDALGTPIAENERYIFHTKSTNFEPNIKPTIKYSRLPWPTDPKLTREFVYHAFEDFSHNPAIQDHLVTFGQAQALNQKILDYKERIIQLDDDDHLVIDLIDGFIHTIESLKNDESQHGRFKKTIASEWAGRQQSMPSFINDLNLLKNEFIHFRKKILDAEVFLNNKYGHSIKDDIDAIEKRPLSIEGIYHLTHSMKNTYSKISELTKELAHNSALLQYSHFKAADENLKGADNGKEDPNIKPST